MNLAELDRANKLAKQLKENGSLRQTIREPSTTVHLGRERKHETQVVSHHHCNILLRAMLEALDRDDKEIKAALSLLGVTVE